MEASPARNLFLKKDIIYVFLERRERREKERERNIDQLPIASRMSPLRPQLGTWW